MIKKGDTLIEVTLAVGIFSMVAIAVVAVMTAGVSNAQTALETTLAREEIDTQAEALRFVHSAYIADPDSYNTNANGFSKLWKKITEKAYKPGSNQETNKLIQQYSPASCYKAANVSAEARKYAFVINPRQLTNPENAYVERLFVNGEPYLYGDAQTYPRLTYKNNTADALIENFGQTNLEKAEGIYVIAVADPDKSNYYDFYIRTCWYGTGSTEPTTISTVIRLYNPKPKS